MGCSKHKRFNLTASELRVSGHEVFRLFDLFFRKGKKLNRFFNGGNPGQSQLLNFHQFSVDRRGSIDFREEPLKKVHSADFP